MVAEAVESQTSADARVDMLESIATGLWIPQRLVLPASWVGHVPFGSWLVKALRPRTVVELGVHTGNSFFTFAEASVRHEVPVQLYGIDTWGGDAHAGAYAEDVYADVSAYTAAHFADRVHLVRKRFEEAVDDFADGSIDLLHIDGLHTYEAVKGDFETWRRKLSDRAVVLFHDIAVTTDGFGVDRFWAEISPAFRHVAFTHSNGLGVLFIGSRVPAEVAALAERDARRAAATLFEKLGGALCRMLEHGPDATALPVNSDLDPPRFYLAGRDDYDESYGAGFGPVAGYPGLLRRELQRHPASGPLILRIDPMSHVGLRGIHRALLVPLAGGAPVELKPSSTDRRANLVIVPTDEGTIFVATADDSQWYPALGADARACIEAGAALVLEPIAIPNAMLGRLLLRAVDRLAAPLQTRIDRLEALERQPTFALAQDIEKALATTTALLPTEGGDADTATWTDVVAKLDAANSEIERLRNALNATRAEHDAESSARDASRQRLFALAHDLANADGATSDDVVGSLEADQQVATGADVVVERMRQDPDATTAFAGRMLQGVLHRNAQVRGALVRRGEAYRGALVILKKKYANALQGRPPSVESDAPFLLEPASGVIPVDDAATRWRSIDNDPQFALSELCNFRGRWVRLSLDLEFHMRHSGSPVVYFDCGQGMSEVLSVKMPRPSAGMGTTSLILPVPRDLMHARFDPCSGPSTFTLSAVRITPMSKLRAIRAMGRTIATVGRLQALWEDYRPHWYRLGSSKMRHDLKTDFVEAYRHTVCSASSTYTEWIRLFELPASAYETLAQTRALWPRRPRISILMPTYNTPARLLREAIDSVVQQNYVEWELCIVDDASTEPEVRRILQAAAQKDARIKVAFRKTNGHIVAASNDALALATGEFAALLDHDDRLHRLALHYMAEAIVDRPDAALIFSDEDKITMDGVRHQPHFKSDFNDPLILAQNSVNHLGCYSVAKVREIGGFRNGLEGAQDWDLVLRIYERFGAEHIVHVPRVLYHWRETVGSTALATTEKPYAEEAGRRALVDYLDRRGIAAEVLPVPEVPSWNRIRFHAAGPLPKVTIVIPTRDKADVLATCVDSILAKSTYPDYEIVIVDNGSVEHATASYLASLPSSRVRIIRDDSPFNYSRLNNRAVEQANGAYICLLNNDTEVLTPDWLEELVTTAQQPDVGIVGARLWYPDGRLQHAGVVLGIGGVAGHVHALGERGAPGYFGRAIVQQRFSAVTAACLLVSKDVWHAVGGLDEELEVAFNDIDFCIRVTKTGRTVVWTPFAELVHYESLSRGADDTPVKSRRFEAEKAIMRQRWSDVLEDDPCYSPNLSLVPFEDFGLSWEPRLP